jgi:hypothetical protein
VVSACTRHCAAHLRAFAAGVGAFSTVIHLVLAAFLTASIAYLRAELADLLSELRSPRHLAHRERADVCATAIQLDASNHRLHLRFVQTLGRAVFARFHALVARFDTVFVFLV